LHHPANHYFASSASASGTRIAVMGDHLEEALFQFGYSHEDYEMSSR